MEDTFALTEAYESLLLEASEDAKATENWKRMIPSGAQKSENSDSENEVYECPTRTKAQHELAVRFLQDNREKLPNRRMFIRGPYRMKQGKAFIDDGSMIILPLKCREVVEDDWEPRETWHLGYVVWKIGKCPCTCTNSDEKCMHAAAVTGLTIKVGAEFDFAMRFSNKYGGVAASLLGPVPARQALTIMVWNVFRYRELIGGGIHPCSATHWPWSVIYVSI
ncbi:unnamed protein product [Clonostachys chloroleuca]|uniref:Uncharacterized protein n=1 Tax=Clonostachys chloroleuca TaxID=1926264 RepID=A0AA35LRN5_9HYPO|nr:unnamed protein product [Clonostachys chloroleuca]